MKTLNNIQDAQIRTIPSGVVLSNGVPSAAIRLVYLFCLLLGWFCAGIGLLNSDLLLTGEAGCLMMSIVFHYSLVYED